MLLKGRLPARHNLPKYRESTCKIRLHQISIFTNNHISDMCSGNESDWIHFLLYRNDRFMFEIEAQRWMRPHSKANTVDRSEDLSN